MPVAKSFAVSLLGLSGTLIEVEADISSNLPNFILVGLPDASLSESTARVRAATANAGLPLPARRITVNLSPAAVPKHGSSFDLAIAMTVLAATGSVSVVSVERWMHIGELGLNGSIRPIRGILPMVLEAKRLGHSRFIVPFENRDEAQLVEGVELMGFDHITQVANFHGAELEAVGLGESGMALVAATVERPLESRLDMSEVQGQPEAVWAMTVAAAGGHHVWLSGPPGAGKTMLAERLPSILPPLSLEQALETSAIHSIAGRRVTSAGDLVTTPPFEAPHHSASATALIGGGTGLPRPGAISLAHNGVLFLDEAPEFQTTTLESLRQPLEAGEVLIHRSAGSAKFPARIQLVLASNPCPCGNFGVKSKRCECAPLARNRYANKLSGPLLDRIDIQFSVSPASATAIALSRKSGLADSAKLRQQVLAARAAAAERWADTPWKLNSQLPGPYLRERSASSKAALAGLVSALERGRISMRGFDRCLRLAWTIADLDGKDALSGEIIARALFLRGVND